METFVLGEILALFENNFNEVSGDSGENVSKNCVFL